MVGGVNYNISRFSHLFAALPFLYILHHNQYEFKKKKKSVQVQEQELPSTRSSLELTPEATR